MTLTSGKFVRFLLALLSYVPLKANTLIEIVLYKVSFLQASTFLLEQRPRS